MAFNAEWLTHKGTITDDNRDYCAIALRGGAALYVVGDGSTRGTQSGKLAKAFVKALADRFMAEPFLGNAQDVISFLGELSQSFKTTYTAGRLSFLAMLDLGGDSVTVLHAGDCRLGRIGARNAITWLTRAHTLANATEEIEDEALAQHNDRHVLTWSFRPGKSCEIEVGNFSIMADERLVIATDGYWADLDREQKSGFIAKSYVPSVPQRDDVSCLLLSRQGKGDAAIIDEGTENFYLVRI